MEHRRTRSILRQLAIALAAGMIGLASPAQAEECTFTPQQAYEVAKENGFGFRCIMYYEEKNITEESHLTVFPDGSVGCSGKTPNDLGIAWVYMNLFNKSDGLGGNWQLWHYEVSGLPHTRIGAGAPVRLITTMLGPNARYEIKITKMVLTNPYRGCSSALKEAFR